MAEFVQCPYNGKCKGNRCPRKNEHVIEVFVDYLVVDGQVVTSPGERAFVDVDKVLDDLTDFLSETHDLPPGSCPHCGHAAAYCEASPRGCCRDCHRAEHSRSLSPGSSATS